MRRTSTNVHFTLELIWAVKMVLNVLINLVRTVVYASLAGLAYIAINVKATVCNHLSGNCVAMAPALVAMIHSVINAFVIRVGKQMA